jgi:hypothetical protein
MILVFIKKQKDFVILVLIVFVEDEVWAFGAHACLVFIGSCALVFSYF